MKLQMRSLKVRKNLFPLMIIQGAIHKWCHTHRREGGSAKRLRYSISLFSKMGDKGGGVKNLQKWVTSFMEGPKVLIGYFWNNLTWQEHFNRKYVFICSNILQIYIFFHKNFFQFLGFRWSSSCSPKASTCSKKATKMCYILRRKQTL